MRKALQPLAAPGPNRSLNTQGRLLGWFWHGNGTVYDCKRFWYICFMHDQKSCLLKQYLFSCTCYYWYLFQKNAHGLMPKSKSMEPYFWVHKLSSFFELLFFPPGRLDQGFSHQFLKPLSFIPWGLFHTLKLNNAATAWRTLMEHARRFLGIGILALWCHGRSQMNSWKYIETFTHEVKEIYIFEKTYITLHCISLQYLYVPLPYITCVQTLPYLTLEYLPIPYQSLPYLTIPYRTLPDLTGPYRTYTHTYTHAHIHTVVTCAACIHTYRHTDRQTDRQSYILT